MIEKLVNSDFQAEISRLCVERSQERLLLFESDIIIIRDHYGGSRARGLPDSRYVAHDS